MSFKEVEIYLKNQYNFRYNIVTDKVEYKLKKEKNYMVMDDRNQSTLFRELKNNHLRISDSGLHKLLMSNFSKDFDPFEHYYNNLPQWDGNTDHFADLFSTIQTHNDKDFQWAFKKWFTSMVLCSLNKDVNHTVLILNGKQGIGKTTWLSNLVPKQLEDYYYSGTINPKDKDTIIQLSENLIINMDELASFDQKQIEGFKEIITKANSKIRKPYGRYSKTYDRRASFVGSTNNGNILTDTTGNRRFLVFTAMNIEYKAKINIDLIYSQAISLIYQGFKHYFDLEDIKRIESNNEIFVQKCEERELLEEFFRLPNQNDKIEVLNATEIIEYINSNSKNRRFNLKNNIIGKELNAIGYDRVKKGYKVTKIIP